MFESIKNKFIEGNKNSSIRNISFDFKLMFVYHITMMVLFCVRPPINAKLQIIFTMLLAITLFIVSIIHKVKSRWVWPGLSLLSIPSIIFQLIFLYLFFTLASYSMNSSYSVADIPFDSLTLFVKETWPIILQAMYRPVLTPWFFAGFGIVMFNILGSLSLVTQDKSEFESQCINS